MTFSEHCRNRGSCLALKTESLARIRERQMIRGEKIRAAGAIAMPGLHSGERSNGVTPLIGRSNARAMLMHVRATSGFRYGLAALALFALVLKILVPAGYMPGTGLAQPIMLCPGQGPMPMMAAGHGSHRDPSEKAPHGGNDHPCTFAGIGATPLAADLNGGIAIPVTDRAAPLTASARAVAPGRGMAAPPPPSHAPPASRA